MRRHAGRWQPRNHAAWPPWAREFGPEPGSSRPAGRARPLRHSAGAARGATSAAWWVDRGYATTARGSCRLLQAGSSVEAAGAAEEGACIRHARQCLPAVTGRRCPLRRAIAAPAARAECPPHAISSSRCGVGAARAVPAPPQSRPATSGARTVCRGRHARGPGPARAAGCFDPGRVGCASAAWAACHADWAH